MRWIALVALMVLFSSACGGGGEEVADPGDSAPAGSTPSTDPGSDGSVPDDSENGTDSTPSTPSTPSTEPANEPAAPAAGTLRMAVATDLQTLDPHRAAPAQSYYLRPAYDSLVGRSADGALAPGLATGWERVDDSTWQLTLRDDVTFADGTAFDADAVVANIERGQGVTESPSAAFYEAIGSATAVDATTVEIELGTPMPSFLDSLSNLPGMMISPAGLDTDLSRSSAGTGGWIYNGDASSEGVEHVYNLNAGYWDSAAQGVEEVRIVLISNNTARVNALQSGEVDIAGELADQDKATVSDAGLDVVLGADADLLFVNLLDRDGTEATPLGDPLVREAMALAIDRVGINEALQLGAGDPDASVFVSGSPGHDPDLDARYPYDPDRARELLAEAGYGDGFSLTAPTIGPFQTTAEAVQQLWGDVGIDLELTVLQPGTQGGELRDGNWPLAVTRLQRQITPHGFYANNLATDAPFNPFGVDNSAYDDLASEAGASSDGDEQADLWRQLYTAAVDDGSIIVLGHTLIGSGVAEGVTGAALLPGDPAPRPHGVRVAG